MVKLKKVFLFVVTVIIFAALVQKAEAQIVGKWDFNGDGKTETMYFVAPETDDESFDCKGECKCVIKFSDKNLPDIVLESCIGGEPDILGDLDGNGTVEIGILPQWWTSCWRSYLIFTLEGGKWQYFVDPIPTHCNLFEEHEGPIIEKVKGKEDQYKIYYSEFDDEDGIVTKTKIVRKKEKNSSL